MNNNTYSIPCTITDAIAHYADFHFMSLEFADITCRNILAHNGYGPLVLDNNEHAAAIIVKSASFQIGTLNGVCEFMLYANREGCERPESREVSLWTISEDDGLLTSGIYSRINNRIVQTSGAGFTLLDFLTQAGLNLLKEENRNILQDILEKLFDSPDESPRRIRFNSTGNFCN